MDAVAWVYMPALAEQFEECQHHKDRFKQLKHMPANNISSCYLQVCYYGPLIKFSKEVT